MYIQQIIAEDFDPCLGKFDGRFQFLVGVNSVEDCGIFTHRLLILYMLTGFQ